MSEMHQVLASLSNGKLHAKIEQRNLMLEQMENESGNVVLSHARPATPLSPLFFWPFRYLLPPECVCFCLCACVCQCVRDYLHCHTFIIVPVLLRTILCSFAQLLRRSKDPKDVGGILDQPGRRAKCGRVQADSCCSIALSCVRWWMIAALFSPWHPGILTPFELLIALG